MKFSFSFVPDSTQFADFEGIIRKADEDGFDIAWTPDQGYMVDPFVGLTLAARNCTQMRLGVGVSTPFMRHPMQLARAAASLSNLSDGRFILGLGAGEKARIREPMGAPVGPFAEVMRDTFVALRALFDGERVTIENSAFRLSGIALEMVSKHYIPIYLATTSPAAFRLAGAYADGVIVGDISDPHAMKTIVGWIREGAEQAGRNPDDIDVVAWVATIVTDNQTAIFERLRRRVVGTAVSAMAKRTRGLVGVNEAHLEQIKAARRNEEVPLPEEVLPTEVVHKTSLVGSADDLVQRIAALESVGVTTMAFRMPVALQDKIAFSDNLTRLHKCLMQPPSAA